MKKYKLIDSNGKEYFSDKPGTLGGNKKLKIYGRLDCPSANRWVEKGYYVNNRVFFEDEQTAVKAGYRPCAVCMKEKYKKWKDNEIRNDRYRICMEQRNCIISEGYARQLKKLLEECSRQFYVDEKGIVRQKKKKY